jgi:ATP-dependent Lon protease
VVSREDEGCAEAVSPRLLARLRSLFRRWVARQQAPPPGLTRGLAALAPEPLLARLLADLGLPGADLDAILEPARLQGRLERLARWLESRLEEPFGRVCEAVPAGLERDALPEAVRRVVEAETRRLERLPALSAERAVLQGHVEWLLALPWSRACAPRRDLDEVRRILDRHHAGLEEAKERVLETAAILLRTGRLPPTVLALVGPPGVGKTSFARAIAAALGRPLVRMSLAGLRDEAEIRGHRRTYVGAMPGRILMGMRRAGCVNPVFLLDEVDKVPRDARGDPAAALLEVLDPELNRSFVDLYLGLPYDLSQVLFVVTANETAGLPPALEDRLEVLRMPGYDEEEKVRIAREFLIPRLEVRHGLEPGTLALGPATLRRLIREYTREPGLRMLERCLARLARQAALRLTRGGERCPRGPGWLRWLGPSPLLPTPWTTGRIGRALALGVTRRGGEVLAVEVLLLEGTGAVEVTGGVGEGLRETVRVLRSALRQRGLTAGWDGRDLHVHFPGCTLRKDGASAGAALALALASALRGLPVRTGVAATGEITLGGEILPVGGMEEKLRAAAGAGLREVLIPAAQAGRVRVPAGLRIRPVGTLDELLRVGLQRTRHGMRSRRAA